MLGVHLRGEVSVASKITSRRIRRFLSVTTVLLLSLCLVDVFDDCITCAPPNVLAEDDDPHFTAAISLPALFAELDLSENTSTTYLTAHESLRHACCHQTTILRM